MHLLYADESGTPSDAAQTHFVLAGFSVFERQSYWIAQEIDKIAARFDPAEPTKVELHGNPLKMGKGIFRRFPKQDRLTAIHDALKVFSTSNPGNRAFAIVVRKSAVSPVDSVEYAFEQLASRFDHYLARLHKADDTQRGLIIFDKSTYETTIQTLATDFRTVGHTWGVLRNMSEVPLFLDSWASRLIQLADLIAYAVFQKFEHDDDSLFTLIEPRFDSVGGVVHGLYVRT
ncbi:MAG TPA: DUF3800 domain-containing protein [Pyrinomonadaceae bacterium]|nr:DUF3800 domain-containing protein [Pyrinomonadaceae bacterium]